MSDSTVIPQQVTDPTILDSVAGFINEVVPTTHSGVIDDKDQIQWASFQQIDCDVTLLDKNYECDRVAPPPLILVLGYTKGVQVWAIPSNGEAIQILSWRHSFVKVLKFIVTPSVGHSNKRDLFASKRPLMALCDSQTLGSQFSSLSLMSLKIGEQVKCIKFINPILDVFSNSGSVVVTFREKVAVFDAFTLENRLNVTTCYVSPGLQPNPVALGARWLVYAEKKLNPSKKSNGGNDGEGVQSYTATVLYAAKSLGKGLREFGESFASSLAGTPAFKPGTSPNSPQAGGPTDIPHKGVVTILDIESPFAHFLEKSAPACDPVVAHFAAHTEAIVLLKFDPSGMLLFTADKRGHDFHLFRIHPHPGGAALAAVHHLYVLHRGDTMAKVQDMCFSPDSRWASVSTLRGTTHVFPITPYGGNVGVRTHTTTHVVNKMSRYHRSAGLTVDGRSNSPIALDVPANSHYPYHNPRFPPYPRPTVVNPLSQIRQPVHVQNTGTSPQRPQTGRQRLSSSSEEYVALGLVSCFAPPRAWLESVSLDSSMNRQQKPVESLFIMSCYGMLTQYDLDPHQVLNVPKERVSSETPIELTVWAKAQWFLQRQSVSEDVSLPMTKYNLSFITQDVPICKKKPDHNDELWLSQVEILTHAGPHRRLWMGPQFTFKTITSGSPLSLAEAQPIDLSHTKPVNMPFTKANAVLIESTSASSCEQSLLETYHRTLLEGGVIGESKLREDLADAMMESPGIKDTGGRCVIVQMKPTVTKVVNPLGAVINVPSDDDEDQEVEVFEEVIHENCDEALFRPVVAPRTIVCRGKTKHYGDNIITRSLDSTTAVAVKILKKSADRNKPKPREVSPKKSRDFPSRLMPKEEPKNNGPKAKVEAKTEIYPSCDTVDYKPQPPSTLKSEFDNNKAINFDLPPLDSEDFFSLENIPKSDTFEDARDCEETSSLTSKGKKKTRLKVDKSYGLDDSSETNTSEENVLEERTLPKRVRKPKSKLGVKIVNINNENLKTGKTLEQCAAEITLPAPIKKSWSSIAASKPIQQKSLIDHTENEKDSGLDMSKIEFMEEFTVHLPRKSIMPFEVSDLIDISTPQERAAEECSVNVEVVVSEPASLLKLDKSSDDEKAQSSSSPGESDDSGKIPELSSVFEDLTDSKTTLVAVSKSSRRRKKKK